MQILRLSIANFKRNIRFYLSYILSLSFSAFILYDFLALMDSGLLEIMEKKNQEFSDMILVSMIVVLLFFVFCFLWYATNVFLNLRKKEMGTFIFMGLDQKEISRMFTLEMLLAALSAVLTGIGAGVVFFKLFAMLFFQLSGMEADISMQFSFVSALQCAAAFLILYLLLAIKGYFSIIKTSIRDMLEATRQREVVRATGLRALLSSLLHPADWRILLCYADWGNGQLQLYAACCCSGHCRCIRPVSFAVSLSFTAAFYQKGFSLSKAADIMDQQSGVSRKEKLSYLCYRNHYDAVLRQCSECRAGL